MHGPVTSTNANGTISRPVLRFSESVTADTADYRTLCLWRRTAQERNKPTTAEQKVNITGKTGHFHSGLQEQRGVHGSIASLQKEKNNGEDKDHVVVPSWGTFELRATAHDGSGHIRFAYRLTGSRTICLKWNCRQIHVHPHTSPTYMECRKVAKFAVGLPKIRDLNIPHSAAGNRDGTPLTQTAQ